MQSKFVAIPPSQSAIRGKLSIYWDKKMLTKFRKHFKHKWNKPKALMTIRSAVENRWEDIVGPYGIEIQTNWYKHTREVLGILLCEKGLTSSSCIPTMSNVMRSWRQVSTLDREVHNVRIQIQNVGTKVGKCLQLLVISQLS